MPITWKEARYSSYDGYLGKARVFTIYWSNTKGETYRLSVSLPGMLEHPNFTGEKEECKALADKIFKRWLEITRLVDRDCGGDR